MEEDIIKQEVERRVNLVTSFAEECIEKDELRKKIDYAIRNNKTLIAYDGMEPSGKIHIAQGLIRAINTNKLIDAGFQFKFYIADWFAKMNLKHGGDLNKIRNSGVEMKIIWEACGMNLDKVEFIWASDEITNRSGEYWLLVLDIATKFNLNRVLKCTQIMGRNETDDLASSQIFYPVMQCADIFFLKADLCSLGMDQRKVNVMAREYCDKAKIRHKPVMVHHHMLSGLDGTKMSKSNPDNAIFMEDSAKDIKRKIGKAFCEPKNIEKNPVLEYFRYIVFEMEKEPVVIERPEQYGGNKKYSIYNDLETEFGEGIIDPVDLKQNCIRYITKYINDVKERLRLNGTEQYSL